MSHLIALSEYSDALLNKLSLDKIIQYTEVNLATSCNVICIPSVLLVFDQDSHFY